MRHKRSNSPARFVPGLLLAFLAAAGVARGDRRDYVWTYQYATLPPGATEFEAYLTGFTQSLPNAATTTSYEHLLELETGVTDHFDLGLYQVLDQPAVAPGERTSLAWGGFKLRGRYRFFERGAFWVDPLVYLEYEQDANLRENGLEARVVLAHDFGLWNAVANLVDEGDLASDTGHRTWRKRLLLSSSYEPAQAYKLGAELEAGDEGNYLGPTVSYAWGDRWATLGASWGWGLAQDFRLRLILGIGL